MSYEEAQVWASYASETGGLNTNRGNEKGFALLALLLSRLMGNKTAKIEDFMMKSSNDIQDATLDNVMSILQQSRTK